MNNNGFYESFFLIKNSGKSYFARVINHVYVMICNLLDTDAMCAIYNTAVRAYRIEFIFFHFMGEWENIMSRASFAIYLGSSCSIFKFQFIQLDF